MIRFIYILLISLFMVGPVNAQVGKIGVVDGEKLFDEYPGAQDASKKIADIQESLRKEIADSEKIYTEFEKQKKSEAEKATKQKELQAKIDTKASEAKKTIESLSVKIEDDILASIKKIAAEKGLEVVLDKRAVLVGAVDITDAVAVELKKKPLANQVTLPSIQKK